jgi:hypothetical protein
VRLARLAAPWTVVCLLGLAAGCAGPSLIRPSATTEGPADTWIVTRDPAVARAVTAPTAPALVARLDAASATPTVLPADKTRVAVTALGPIASIDRTKSYALPAGAHDLAVSFTPAATPPRQDYVVQVGGRSLTILVRERLEAKELARTQPNAHVVPTDAAGVVTVPVGSVSTRSIDLRVETTGLVPWRDGAYELVVPRVPDGDVGLTAEVFGPGPIVIVSSPSHSINAKAVSLEHLRVGLRDPQTLHDGDFVLRYRVDPDDRPGALVVGRDGTGDVVGIVMHPIEDGHEAIAVSDVSIDWNGTAVTEVRPDPVGRLPAGTPLVVLARARGEVRGPITVRARCGREVRAITIALDDAIPAPDLRALPLLWARAGRGTGAAHR